VELRPEIQSDGSTIAQSILPLAPALIAAFVAILVWYLTYTSTQKREDRTRRQTTALEYRQRQIAEFYGPLLSFLEQIHNFWGVRQSLFKAGNGKLSEENRRKIDRYFWATHFRPLHIVIRELLRTKLYLLEDARTPTSFATYIQHSVQEEAQQDLWNEWSIDTSFLEGTPYPREFHEDVKTTLKKLGSQYRGELASLRRDE